MRSALLSLVLFVASVGLACGGMKRSYDVATAGQIGCLPADITISDASRAPNGSHAWRAVCRDRAFICTAYARTPQTRGEGITCHPELEAETRAGEAAPPPEVAGPQLVVRPLPREVSVCVDDRDVAIEALFDGNGRVAELRPWPGETTIERDCVARVLVELEHPRGQRGPMLVRFEPRSPWAED